MNSILGEIHLLSFDFSPQGWMEYAGQTLQVTAYSKLFSLIGTKFGGSGMTSFCLFNLASIGQQSANVKYFIAVEGEYPPR